MVGTRLRFWKGLCVGTMIAASSAIFMYRACLRGWHRGTDLAVVYAAARAWRAGEDPYDNRTLERVWSTAGTEEPYLPLDRPSLYPACTFVLMTPIAALDWPAARGVWLAINVASYLAAVTMLVRWTEGVVFEQNSRTRRWRRLLAAIFALLWAPAHAAISLGQLCLVPFALLISSQMLLSGVPGLSGAAIGLATAMKPQIGLLFLLAQARPGRSRVFAVAAAVVAALSAAGALKMIHDGTDPVRPLVHKAREYATTGFSSPATENPFRHEMIHLPVVLHGFVSDRRLVSGLSLAATAAVAWFGFRGHLHSTSMDVRLYEFILVSMLTLLVFYHRTYDAVLIMGPVVWAAFAIGNERSQNLLAWLVLGLALVFLAPVPAWFAAMERSHQAPASIADSWGWRHVALTHQAWATALTAICVAAASAGAPHAARNAEGQGDEPD